MERRKIMKQMVAPDAPVIARIKHHDIETGFARIDGRIFYLQVHGRFVIDYPVYEDGTISRHGDFPCYPDTIVDLVRPKDLGIAEICLAENEP